MDYANQAPPGAIRVYSKDAVWDAFIAGTPAYYSTIKTDGQRFFYHQTAIAYKEDGKFVLTLGGMNTRTTRIHFNFALDKLGIAGGIPTLPGKLAGGRLRSMA
jgi:hypothetical protein